MDFGEHKKYIDDCISTGASSEKISELLKKFKGVEVSAMDITLYRKGLKNENLEGFDGEIGFSEEFDATEFYNNFTPKEDVSKVPILLKDMYAKQAAKVYDLQEKYLKGEIKFPESDLKNLKLIQDIVMAEKKQNPYL